MMHGQKNIKSVGNERIMKHGGAVA